MTGQVRPKPSTIATQYETLRMAALGEALAPEARAGLMLFLRRGMWAWARALVAENAPAQPNRASSDSVAPHPSKAVIQLFAAMAMNANSRSLQ
jgi:hypothetical protein